MLVRTEAFVLKRAFAKMLRSGHKPGVMWVKSRVLTQQPGIRHAFSTRIEDEDVWAAEAGFCTPVALVHQVHGARAVKVTSGGPKALEADAVWTTTPEIAVAIRTADCLPILLAAEQPGRSAVAAIHAGWRGLARGVIEAQLDALRQAGFQASSMKVAVGPCIGPAAFEVGPEVVLALRDRLGHPPPTVLGPRGRDHVDLPKVAVALLSRAGLPQDAIDVLGECTFSNPGKYASYRRDHATGRQLSAIAFGDRL